MSVEVEQSIQFCCCVTHSRGAVWQNGIWCGSMCEVKLWNWIPPCGKKLHLFTFIDAEHFWSLNCGCEHSEAMGVAFQQWQQKCTEMNISFSALETMVATLKYHKICTLYPQMLTQEKRKHHMQVCQDLLNQCEAEGWRSWIASLPVTRRGVTITSRSQKGSPWSGNMWIHQGRKSLRHSL